MHTHRVTHGDIGGRRLRVRAKWAGLAALPVLALLLSACASERPAQSEAQQPTFAPPAPVQVATEVEEAPLLIVTLAHEQHIAVVDPALDDTEQTAIERIEVGAAPWAVAVGPMPDTVDDEPRIEAPIAYVSTAEGLAVVDLATRTRTALVPYLTMPTSVGYGEYRAGGLGLAVTPDGSRVYVAVGSSRNTYTVEVFDTASGTFIAEVPVGLRPFDVVVAPDGSWAASIDHDSFTVTVIDAATLAPRTIEVAPFGTQGGLASWEKGHYGSVTPDGRILLPYQGAVVASLDPISGAYERIPQQANSHAHGTDFAGTTLFTVGTGSFGNATGGPNLSILDIATGQERVVPLRVPHENVAAWTAASGQAYAAVAGGNTREEGWDGLTLVNLSDLSLREIPVPGYPQDVAAFVQRVITE